MYMLLRSGDQKISPWLYSQRSGGCSRRQLHTENRLRHRDRDWQLRVVTYHTTTTSQKYVRLNKINVTTTKMSLRHND